MVPNEPTERTFSHAWALLVAMGLVPEHCRIMSVSYCTVYDRQCTYDAPSLNHCCRGKFISVTYSVCVTAASVI